MYDWFLISGVIVSNAVYSVMTGTLDVLGTLAGVTGVICVVLVAKGSIWNYLFGLVNVSLYAYISYKAALYGDAALNALYYLLKQQDLKSTHAWLAKAYMCKTHTFLNTALL